MSISSIRARQFLLIFLSVLLFIFLIKRSNEIAMLQSDNNVTFGTVVINNGDIEKGISLTGTYKYVEDKILSPSELKYQQDEVKSLTVYDRGAFLSGHKATISFDIYNYTGENLTLQFKDIINYYNIYVNGIFFSTSDTDVGSTLDNKSYIDVPKNRKTEIVLQMRRDDYFLFGFLTPPKINTYTNLLNEENRVKYSTIIVSLLTIIYCVFLSLLSILRSKSFSKNFHIFVCFFIGLIIVSNIVFTSLSNNGVIHANYFDFIKYRMFEAVIISYSLFLLVYFHCDQARTIRNLSNGLTYALFVYLIFLIVTPSVGQELLFKASFIFILANQIATLYVAQKNILSYQKNGIYSFIIVALIYVFAFSYPDIIFSSYSSYIVVSFLFVLTIFILKISRENYKSFANFRYLTEKQKLLNEIYTNEISTINKRLEIESNTKNHAIRIVEETKKRDIATGLYNRTYMTKLISTTIASLRKDEIISLIIIDIDNLKHINEVYGHIVADSYISDVAKRLLDYKTQNDYIARWTGGSFLMFFTNIEYATAAYIAESIRLVISNTRFQNGDTATASIGVCCADMNSTLEDTERTLNNCLEIAKSIGKNCVYTDTQLSERLLENNLDSSSKISDALTNN